MKPIVLAISLLLASCVSAPRGFDYDIVAVNPGDDEFLGVEIWDASERQPYRVGVLAARGYARRNGPFAFPPNSLFTVKWITPTGGHREQTIDARKLFPRRFMGQIVFIFEGGNSVRIEFVQPPKFYPVPQQRNSREWSERSHFLASMCFLHRFPVRPWPRAYPAPRKC